FGSICLCQCFASLQTGKPEKSNTLNAAIDNMSKKTRDLRRQVKYSHGIHF
ncbi:hypothetical protein LEMLEM_LOCUS13737, partial [Lemmus lemmus]